MFTRNSSANQLTTTHTDSRLDVADILSTMANSNQAETVISTSFSALDGFSTGIITQTTPTLTPTTLRNIEQTFIELQSVPPTQIEHQNQAGFVPPVVNRPSQSSPAAPLQHSAISSTPSSRTSQPIISYHNMNPSSVSKNVQPAKSESWNNNSTATNVRTKITTKTSSGRNMGGRKPSRTEKLSPEEEERRRVRRERNKMAAARCRKRRLDHTNLLVNETNMLEDKRNELQNEIQLLQSQKDELEFLLETHKVVCKIAKRHMHLHQHLNDPDDIKPNLNELNEAMKMAVGSSTSHATSAISTSSQIDSSWEKKTPIKYESNNSVKSTIQRPNSLPITSNFATPNLPATSTINNSFKASITEATGIAITTPSSGIFNFEALMEGGTGLTPVISSSGLNPMIPTCSTQQRSSSSDLSSPDSITSSKLVSL